MTSVAHLYFCCPQTITPEAAQRCFERLLSPSEQARLKRFRFPRDQHLYRVSHALLRCALSQHGDCPPEGWSFTTNAYGKPAVAGTPGAGPVFNLTHTRSLAVCAIAAADTVGVDVEAVSRSVRPRELAGRFFAPCEAADVLAQPPAAIHERFFAYWTLKESYIKARGRGLAIPLDAFSFHPVCGGGLELEVLPREAREDPWTGSWQAALLADGAGHRIALSLPSAAPTFRVELHSLSPLESLEPALGVRLLFQTGPFRLASPSP